MKNIMTNKVIKDMICTVALVLPIHIGTGILFPAFNITESGDNALIGYALEADPHLAKPSVVLLDLKGEYCDATCTLTQNIETVEFFTKAFGVEVDDIKTDVAERNKDIAYDINNIGALKNKSGEYKKYDSFERGFIEYLYDYTKKNPSKVNNKYVPYKGTSKYVEDLIRYYTSIYTNVDYLTAISIGAAESGYYKVTFMLSYNNVYGGMSSNGLIKHKNIEMGVLSFIRMLSLNYYGEGLTTPESIGRVYCPRIENGKKVASSNWLNLVAAAKKHYKDSYKEITAAELLEDYIAS